jgi:sucrose-6-phosphate hydrolase SacC (GH32 family)
LSRGIGELTVQCIRESQYRTLASSDTARGLVAERPFLTEVKGAALEIRVEIEPGNAAVVGVGVRRSADGKSAVPVSFDGSHLEVAGLKVPFQLPASDKAVRLHLFLDRTVLEVYANEGAACATRIVQADPDAQDIEMTVLPWRVEKDLFTRPSVDRERQLFHESSNETSQER